MAHTVVIETREEADYQLLIDLAQRLGLPIREIGETAADQVPGSGEAIATKRPLGTMKGSFILAPDFDAPLTDLSDYM